MKRTRRNMQTDHEEALKAGKTTEFDPKRPWNAVWAKVVNNEAFWREEVIEPAIMIHIMILTKVAGLNDMVQGDAATAKASPAVAPREEQPVPAQMARAAKTVAPSGHATQVALGEFIKLKVESIWPTGQDTKFVLRTTRDPVQMEPNGWCADAWDTVHQCHRWLVSHPATRCPHQEMPTPGFLRTQGKAEESPRRGEGAIALTTD